MKITIPVSLGVMYASAHGAAAGAGFISLPLTRQNSSQTLARRQADLIWNDYRGYPYFVDGMLLPMTVPSPLTLSLPV
jgi:hypothetical protein